MTAKVLEKHLEQQCSDILALDDWRSLKTDPVSRREWGKGFGEKGMADRLYLRYGREDPNFCVREWLAAGEILWIEWKRLGGKLKPHQKQWIEAERLRGALVVVAGLDFPATFEGFLEWYRTCGLMRRRVCERVG